MHISAATRIDVPLDYVTGDPNHVCFFMAVAGSTRLRKVQSVARTLARGFWLEGITSLAVAPFFNIDDDQTAWDEIKKVLEQWFSPGTLPVIIYNQVQVGSQMTG